MYDTAQASPSEKDPDPRGFHSGWDRVFRLYGRLSEGTPSGEDLEQESKLKDLIEEYEKGRKVPDDSTIQNGGY